MDVAPLRRQWARNSCEGISQQQCAAKLSEKKAFAGGLVADFVPILGDVKAFAEAKDPADYLLAVIGTVAGPVGDALGAIRKAEKAAEVADVGKNVATVEKRVDDAVDGAKAVKDASTSTLREVEITSGSKGNWNKELNNPQPNTVYKVDQNKIYQTDNLGRVEHVEADLSSIVKDRNTYQQCKAGKCGLPDDEGGHLIASIFHGPEEKLNLVPMDGNLNKGAWKQMENTWSAALKEGKQVNVKIEPVYSGSGIRPDKFVVSCQIGTNRPVREIFNNAPGGK